jgi:hypothetical protein
MHDPTLKVCAERCPGCPFGPTPCVSRERARELLAAADRADKHFVCHEWVAAGGDPVTCAGYYAARGPTALVFRFASFAGIPVEFVGRPEGAHA